MTRRSTWISVCAGFACLVVLPSDARAQSSIAGSVTDRAGSVLSGVTVEVTGPALFEGVKHGTTDDGGAYRLADLAPGVYAIRFSLTGFKTLERSAFQLLPGASATLDAQLEINMATHVTVLDRSAIDHIPTGQTIQGLGQLILGVSLSAPDVGGSAGAMQTYMSLHGNSVSAANNTVLVDGMVINGLQSDGAVQTYINHADFQEVTYQTAGIGAERSAGGVTLSLVPKEGGNRFSGAGAAAYRPGQLQGDNYSLRLKDWGLTRDIDGNPVINRIDHIYDVTASEGGPLKKDRLWFFLSGRLSAPVNTVPNTFLNDGTQGLDDNYIRQSLLRLTYQTSPRHKLSAYYERVYKWRGHDMGAFQDPETTALVWLSPNYSTAAAKYTGSLSNRLVVEGGYSQNVEYYRNVPQPDIDKARGSPEWYATAAHTAAGGGAGVAPTGSTKSFPASQVWQGSASYVTGAHHARAGVSWRFGKYDHGADANADLSQGYPVFVRDSLNNVAFPASNLSNADFARLFPSLSVRPCAQGGAGTTSASTCSATIRDTPRATRETLNHDLGIYVQDSFTIHRLTLNAGFRYEMLNAQAATTTSGAGRFVPARTTRPVEDLPTWKDWAPRLHLAYDLFGHSRTVLKYSFNRYNEAVTTSVAADFNPTGVSTSTRNWTDINSDDIAQGGRTWNADGTYVDCVYLNPGCEINLSGTANQGPLSPTFGLVGAAGGFAPSGRRYRLEHTIELQHALHQRLMVTGTYYHGESRNLSKTVNLARTDGGYRGTQYVPVNLFNPLDGTPYVTFNQIETIPDANVTYLEPLRKAVYDTYTAEFQLRHAGALLTGGIELNRTLARDCQSSAVQIDGVTPALPDPNTMRFCDQWNMVAFEGGPPIGKPFTKNFKLASFFTIPYGINIGVAYQNIDSGDLSPTFRYGTAFRYPDGSPAYRMLSGSSRVPACPTTYGCVPGGSTVPAGFIGSGSGTVLGNLFAPGTVPDERIVQLDVKASKNLRFGRISVEPSLEAFNVFNTDHIRSRSSLEYANASGTYLTPSNTLQGRIIGFGANMKW